MGIVFTRGVKALSLIHHVHDGRDGCDIWKDYKVLPGVTGRSLVSIQHKVACTRRYVHVA